MSFLQPWMLFALPLVALPILIHLLNRHRHRSVRWAAMMFLVTAKRTQRGMARLRYVLIMLLRMLAIAVLVFAVSRPLASGRLGGAGLSRPDVTAVLLDRSASMETQDLQTGESRRSTALRKLAALLEQRGFGNQLVLIDSASGEARELTSPADLLELPATEPTATSADVPGMLEAALAVLDANEAGRADVWVCSDLSENDWDPTSGRWDGLRREFAAREGVEHYLLSYSGRSSDNVAVRVENVRRRRTGDRAALVVDLRLLVDGSSVDVDGIARVVPVEIEIDGVTTVVDMELGADGASLTGHRIPLDEELRTGWGVARVPGDSNALDNAFYFSFAEPPTRRAVVVSDDAGLGASVRRVLAIPSEPGVPHEPTVLGTARVGEIDWERTGLVVWHAPLPEGLAAEQLTRHVDAGRVAMIFPTEGADDGEFLGVRWGAWQSLEGDARELSTWRGDSDLFAHVRNGDPLPLDELRTFRHRPIEGVDAGTPLARLSDGAPLFVRAPTDRGALYFSGTLPRARSSSLERDAVAFYVMLHRALELGARPLSPAIQLDADAGALTGVEVWETVAPIEDAPTLSQRGLLPGVYRNGETLAAVNRSLAEDTAAPASSETIDALFEGLSFRRIEDEVGDESSLASEIWRLFLLLMALALIGEALLCLPPKSVAAPKAADEGFPASGEVGGVAS